MQRSDSEVQVKEAVFITPSNPTPSHILKLSAIDSWVFLGFTIDYLLIYAPVRCGPIDRAAVTARVKDALARALVPYYPLAGRVRARPDGSGHEVDCRGQGALFVEAAAAYAVADFERAPRYITEWRPLLADMPNDFPPLVVQMTWLAEDAVALGVCFGHCICDGVGSGEFLNHFADLAVGRRGTAAECRSNPVWERHLLDPKPIRRQTQPGQDDEFNRVPDLCKFMTRFSDDQLTPTSFTFEEPRLNELKDLVGSTSQLSRSSLTSFEVLAAHIWRSWAQALNFPSGQILKLHFTINIRNRVEPSLHSGYYGNATATSCAQTTARDLTELGLGSAAELIKEAKN